MRLTAAALAVSLIAAPAFAAKAKPLVVNLKTADGKDAGTAAFTEKGNKLVIKLDPATGVRLLVEAQGGEAEPRQVHLDMEFADEGGEGAAPYEVLLHAAMMGQSVRFTRQYNVEETWRVLQPLLDAPPPVHTYAKGGWGPAAANDLVADHGGWYGPWIA